MMKGMTMAIRSYEVNLENNVSENSNVIEIYKNSTLREIRADLDTRRSGLVNVCMNLTKDFNKASVIRANNAFLGSHVYLVGKRHYNRVGSVGTHLYEHVSSADTLAEVIKDLKRNDYTVYAVDNIDSYNPKNVWDVDFPENAAFVYGEEQRGLQPEEIDLCDDMVYINQVGSVRSLNIAQAAAVIMSEYSRQHRI